MEAAAPALTSNAPDDASRSHKRSVATRLDWYSTHKDLERRSGHVCCLRCQRAQSITCQRTSTGPLARHNCLMARCPDAVTMLQCAASVNQRSRSRVPRRRGVLPPVSTRTVENLSTEIDEPARTFSALYDASPHHWSPTASLRKCNLALRAHESRGGCVRCPRRRHAKSQPRPRP